MRIGVLIGALLLVGCGGSGEPDPGTDVAPNIAVGATAPPAPAPMETPCTLPDVLNGRGYLVSANGTPLNLNPASSGCVDVTDKIARLCYGGGDWGAAVLGVVSSARDPQRCAFQVEITMSGVLGGMSYHDIRALVLVDGVS